MHPPIQEGQESCAPARRAAGKPARAAPQAVATQETREHPADGRAAQPQPPSSLWGGTAAPLMKSGGYAASPDACLDGEQLESSAEEVPQSLTTAAPTDGHLAPQAPPSITHPEIPQPTSSGSSPCAARLPVCQEFELQREELLADAEAAAAPSSTGVSAPPAAVSLAGTAFHWDRLKAALCQLLSKGCCDPLMLPGSRYLSCSTHLGPPAPPRPLATSRAAWPVAWCLPARSSRWPPFRLPPAPPAAPA